MMKKILLFLTMSFFSANTYTQKCGVGVFSIELYILNGEKQLDLDYELLPVSQRFVIDSIIRKDDNFYNQQIKVRNYYEGVIVREDLALNILLQTVSSQDERKFEKFVSSQSFPVKGTLKQKIDFKTIETVFFPVILRLKSKTGATYILANFFGGCDRVLSLLGKDGKIIRVNSP